MKPSHYAGFALLLMLASAALALTRPDPPAQAYLSGQFLVASQTMADPFFSKTVIYLMAHSEQGAMGVIINRPAGKASLQKLLAALGIKSRVKTRVEVFLGGPVELGKGLILHSPDYSAASTQIVAAGLAVSTGVDVLQDLANGKGPRQSRLVVGYAGWSAGQLEREIAHGDWLSAPVDPALVFSAPDEMWSKALLHAGIRL